MNDLKKESTRGIVYLNTSPGNTRRVLSPGNSHSQSDVILQNVKLFFCRYNQFFNTKQNIMIFNIIYHDYIIRFNIRTNSLGFAYQGSTVEPQYSHFVFFTRCELFAWICHILVCVKYTYDQVWPILIGTSFSQMSNFRRVNKWHVFVTPVKNSCKFFTDVTNTCESFTSVKDLHECFTSVIRTYGMW